jgi:hypothetical protein
MSPTGKPSTIGNEGAGSSGGQRPPFLWRPIRRITVVDDAESLTPQNELAIRRGTAKEWTQRIDSRLTAQHRVYADGTKTVRVTAIPGSKKELRDYSGLAQWLMNQS